MSQQSDLYHGVFETVLDGVITIDEGGTIESVNPAAERMFGFAQDEVIGRNVSMLMDEPYISQHDSYIRRYCGTGEARIIGIGREVSGRRKDGAVFPMHLGVTQHRGRSGRRFIGLIHDLTAQRAAERQRDRYFSVSHDLLCTASFEGYFVTVNPAWTETLGWERHELLVRPFGELIHPEDRERTAAELSGLSRGESVKGFQNRYRRRDGGYAWLDWTAVPVVEERLIYASARDISLAKDIERHKDELISWVSHELRTPLTALFGSLRLLEGGAAGALSGRAADLVQIANRNCRRLTRLVDDILEVERIAAGRIEVELREHELGGLVDLALENNQDLGVARGVRFERAPSTDRLPVRVDADRFQQVMSNLLSNAAKFSPEGGAVRVEVNLANDSARVSVTDRGPGIPVAFMERIFTRFARAAGTSDVPGSGLGLAISRSLVEMQGGTIAFESVGGAGTTFFVDLPLDRG